MTEVRRPVSSHTFATGFSSKLAYVEAVDEEKFIAIVRDKMGYRHTVRTDVLAAKSAAPAVGETWMIDRSQGQWTFAAIIAYRPQPVPPTALAMTVLPTPHATHRGQLVLIPGATGVADVVYVCVKGTDDAYTWRVLSLAP